MWVLTSTSEEFRDDQRWIAKRMVPAITTAEARARCAMDASEEEDSGQEDEDAGR